MVGESLYVRHSASALATLSLIPPFCLLDYLKTSPWNYAIWSMSTFFFSDSIRWFCIHLKLIMMEVISGYSAFTRSSVSVKISTENFQWETQILRRHPLLMDTYFGGSYFLFQPIWLDSKCGHEKREKSRRSILTSWRNEYKVIQHWILSPSSHQAVP